MQGTGEVSKASDFPRSSPGYFPELSANLGPISSVHVRNYSVWCYDDADIRDLLQDSEDDAKEGAESSLPAWIPWLIAICAPLLPHA